MASEHEIPEGFAPEYKAKNLKKTNIFFGIKQFIQKDICSLCRKIYTFVLDCCRTLYGVRGFKFPPPSIQAGYYVSHPVWGAWI